MRINDYLNEWLSDQKDKQNRSSSSSGGTQKTFAGNHKYKHFDLPVALRRYSSKGNLRNELMDINSLKRHKYYPLIRRDKYNKKYTINNQKELVIELKCRPIMYAAHRDAPIFSFYGFILRQIYEQELASTPGLSECVIAYRRIPREDIPTRNKSNIDFAKDAFIAIGELDEDAVILCLDIKGFFDNLTHSHIKDSISSIVKDADLKERLSYVLKPLLKYRYVFYKDVENVYGNTASSWADSTIFNRKIRNTDLIHKSKKKKGIPQGTPISDIIANIYMLNFDRAILKMISKLSIHYYRRYSDDIFLIIPKGDVEKIYQNISKTLDKYGLHLGENKTEAFIYKNKTRELIDCSGKFIKEEYKKNRPMLQYLGFIFDTDNIYIRPKSLAKLAKKRKRLIKKRNRCTKPRKIKTTPQISPLAYLRRAAENIDVPSLKKQTIKQRKKFK